jgi:hypothetical protein
MRRLANQKGHKHRSFQALDLRSVVGPFQAMDVWLLHAIKAMQLFDGWVFLSIWLVFGHKGVIVESGTFSLCAFGG